MDTSQVFVVLGAIVGLAVIAVIIINGDKTVAVITSAGAAFTGALHAALNPGQAS